MLAAETLRTFQINPTPNLIFSGTVSHSNITNILRTYSQTLWHTRLYTRLYI